MEKCCGNCKYSGFEHSSQSLRCYKDYAPYQEGGNTYTNPVSKYHCCNDWAQDPDCTPAATQQASSVFNGYGIGE